MKDVTEVLEGEIVEFNERVGYIMIKVPYDDWFTLCKRECKNALVQLIDSRQLSRKQRNMCYALLRAIGEYMGESLSTTKYFFKLKYMVEEINSMANTLFSLSNAPMSIVCGFQRFLVRFIIENSIPCKKPLIEYVEDIDDYIYTSLINKKCCVCGKDADLHHLKAVGAGRDRTKIIHEGMEVLPLCREHHTECHKIGRKTFLDKYHLQGNVKLDKALCKIYKLKKKDGGYDVTQYENYIDEEQSE